MFKRGQLAGLPWHGWNWLGIYGGNGNTWVLFAEKYLVIRQIMLEWLILGEGRNKELKKNLG